MQVKRCCPVSAKQRIAETGHFIFRRFVIENPLPLCYNFGKLRR